MAIWVLLGELCKYHNTKLCRVWTCCHYW